MIMDAAHPLVTDVLDDQAAREAAINPAISSVVQAPAGSGKTSLLVLRILNLLAAGNAPDSLLILTFTNKAARQMAQRIALSLKDTSSALVQQILTLNKRCNWHLEEGADRVLRIQTIDSFSAYLVNTLLLDAVPNRLVQGLEAEFYYDLAVRRYLEDFRTTSGVETLLSKADFHYEQLVSSFKKMLARRDCWLSFLLSLDTRSLKSTITRELLTINEQYKSQVRFPGVLWHTWQQLYIANQQFLDGDNLACQAFLRASSFNDLTISDAKIVASWLLTKEDSWRQQLTAKQGVITPKNSNQNFKRFKAELKEFLQQLSALEPLRLQLAQLLHAPDLEYAASQEEAIEAILKVLPALLATLKLVWQEYNLMDYTELSVLASFALDPALNEHGVDTLFNQKARWKHLLVDEFQDTSLLHFKLLSQLTEEWSSFEGCSIFLVGDPMQSIYRFRQAEVGLFLKAQQEGLGGLKLTKLTLTSNFRSAPNLVNWANQHLKGMFPVLEDMNLGAVKFSPSTPASSAPFSEIKTITADNASSLQRKAVTLIKNLQREDPSSTIAVLALNRTKLYPLAEALIAEHVVFEAVELTRLSASLLAKQLWALMRLSLEPSKSSNWVNWWLTRYQALPDIDFSNVNEDFRKTLKELGAKLDYWLTGVTALLYDGEFLDRYQLWTYLLANLNINAEDVYSAAIISQFQELWEMADAKTDVQVLESRFLEMYLPSFSELGAKLQLMTIHKAKGLEFDKVILMELNSASRKDALPLVLWQAQLYTKHQQPGLLLAARLVGEQDLGLYFYLASIERRKTQLEQVRLFYVAVTRAKHALYLLASQPDDVTSGSLWQLYSDANR